MKFKSILKKYLQSKPIVWSVYWTCKQQVKRIFLLRYFFYDIRQTYAAMHWSENNFVQNKLSAELLFQYHKIEKGLAMPGPSRLFGVEPALASIKLVRRWIACGFPRHDTVYLGALETLRSYHNRIGSERLDPQEKILSRLDKLFSDCSERSPGLSTPVRLDSLVESMKGEKPTEFEKLAVARRSVRNFKPDLVPMTIIEKAVKLAQLSPSACNRQPCRLYLVSDSERRNELLSYQNGNRGFGHLAPHIAILTVDEGCFFDASERHEPYIDGGLFAMSLIIALKDLGVSSCCLNWCVPPKNDVSVHRSFDIPNAQRIIMLIAIGYDQFETLVPRSPRRLTTNVFQILT